MPRTEIPDASRISPLKSYTCCTLSGTSTLEYEIGRDPSGKILIRIVGNDGGGLFSREWIAWKDVRAACEKVVPITSAVLVKLFTQKSANTPGFLLAVLVALKLLEPLPDRSRQFQMLDPAPFLSRVAKLAKSTLPAARKTAKKAAAKKSPPKKKSQEVT